MLLELIDAQKNRLGSAEIRERHWNISNESARWQNTAQVDVRIERAGTVLCCRLWFDKGRKTRMAYNGQQDVVPGNVINFPVGSLQLDLHVWRRAVKRGTMAAGEAIINGG